MRLEYFASLAGANEAHSVTRLVSDSVAPWTVARQAPPSVRLSRQEYWSGLPLPPPGGLPNPGIKPGSPPCQAGSGGGGGGCVNFFV